MTKRKLLLLGVCLLTLSSAYAGRDQESWPIREQETVDKSFPLTAQPLRVIVDNVEGYVHVIGSGGSQVRLRAHKTIRAQTPSDLDTAKREVNLAITEKPGSVDFYYDAPWRCKGDRGSCDGDTRHFYTVVYDMDLEVPRDARIVISTVNNGDIQVDKTAGDFEVRGVNSGIAMTNVSGSGGVSTVNGPVTVRFAANPRDACSFKTINGKVDVYFHGSLSAALFFKTFNGQVYSDFNVTPDPQALTGESSRHDGKFIYRSNSFTRGHAGNSGPELKFDTLNGDIRLHQADH